MKNYLVKFDFGLYNAFGESLEVLTADEYKDIVAFSERGMNVYLGEIEGKHSEVSGPLDSVDFEIISGDQEFIEKFKATVGSSFGAFDMLEATAQATAERGEV